MNGLSPLQCPGVERRAVVRALLASLALSTSVVRQLQSHTRSTDPEAVPVGSDAGLRALLEGLCDTIVPRTTTPGACDAGVPGFILKLLNEWYSPEERDGFVKGLGELNERCTREEGRAFLELDAARRLSFLERLDREPAALPAGRAGLVATSSFQALKAATLIGYYTSPLGEEALVYHGPVGDDYPAGVCNSPDCTGPGHTP